MLPTCLGEAPQDGLRRLVDAGLDGVERRLEDDGGGGQVDVYLEEGLDGGGLAGAVDMCAKKAGIQKPLVVHRRHHHTELIDKDIRSRIGAHMYLAAAVSMPSAAAVGNCACPGAMRFLRASIEFLAQCSRACFRLCWREGKRECDSRRTYACADQSNRPKAHFPINTHTDLEHELVVVPPQPEQLLLGDAPHARVEGIGGDRPDEVIHRVLHLHVLGLRVFVW